MRVKYIFSFIKLKSENEVKYIDANQTRDPKLVTWEMDG